MANTQRQGTKSQLVFWPEVAWNDINGATAGYVVPLSDTESFKSDQPLTRANVYTGTRDPRGSLLGMIQATGDIPTGLEFTFVGHVLHEFFGHDVYSRPGSGTLHRWLGFGVPGSCTLEKRFLEAPVLSLLNPGVKIEHFDISQQMSGQCVYTWGGQGSGQETRKSYSGGVEKVTPTAPGTGYTSVPTVAFSGGGGSGAVATAVLSAGTVVSVNVTDPGTGYTSAPTVAITGGGGSGATATSTVGAITDEGYKAVNYFNGYIKKNGISLATVTAFSLSLKNNLSRQDAAFQGGMAAGINAGLGDVSGNLGIIFTIEDGFAYYDNAINFDDVTIECMWTDKPLQVGPTKWIRFIMPVNKISRATVNVGGAAGQTNAQTFMAEVAGGTISAEIYGTAVLPTGTTVTVPAASNLGIKTNGGGTQTISITAGARTLDQIVTEVAATLTGGTVDNFIGRFRGTATTSFQIDTAVSNSIHALLGLDGVARTSLAAAAIVTELQNAKSSNY